MPISWYVPRDYVVVGDYSYLEEIEKYCASTQAGSMMDTPMV